MTELEHTHDETEPHSHWDPLAGEVNADYLTELLEANEKVLGSGIRHLTGELNRMKDNYVRTVEALQLRYAEIGRTEEPDGDTGTT